MMTNTFVFAVTCLCMLGRVWGEDRSFMAFDDEAPGEAPEDAGLTMAPPTRAPDTLVPEVEDVEICRVDADCQSVDTNATCDGNGGCSCSDGFDSIIVDGVELRDCYATDFDQTEKREVQQSGRFAGGDYASFTAEVRAAFIAAWENATQLTVNSAAFAPGSILYVLGFSANIADLARVATSKRALVEALASNPTTNSVLQPTTLETTISTTVDSSCTMEYATSTALLGSECTALGCETGYALFTSATGTQICVVSRVDDSDDDLSGGAIAGIVVGCVFGVVLAFAVAAYICLNANSSEPIEEHEPAHERYAPEPPAPTTEAAVVVSKPAMDQSAAALSAYTTPYGDMEADQSQMIASNAHLEA